MEPGVEAALSRLYGELQGILGGDLSLYLYGSAVLDDFRLGWSDIDLLCVAPRIPDEALERLVPLRQTLLKEEPDNPYYRSFEGLLIPERALTGAEQPCVYWGTSGQRVVSRCSLDVFARYELKTSGVLLYGRERLDALGVPSFRELRQGVQAHLDAIRRYASQTANPLYACGWLLDIARCLFTLRTGRVAAKTAAGEWALAGRLCPDEEALARTLAARREPLRFKNDPGFAEWTAGLGESIQAFADVLEQELARTADGFPNDGRDRFSLVQH